MKNIEFMFTKHLTESLLLNSPEEFKNIKVATWHAMVAKGYKPIEWFVMKEQTKIPYKIIFTEEELSEEIVRLNEFIDTQFNYNRGNKKNESTKIWPLS